MLFESQLAERRQRVRIENLVRGAIRVERERDRHQAANEMRIAVTAKMKDGPAIGIRQRLALDPDLADAAANLVGVVVSGFGQRFERTPEVDHIAIAIFPIVEKGEVLANRFNRRQFDARGECWRPAYNPTDASPASFVWAPPRTLGARVPSREAPYRRR
jgi:hypothetical protein